MHIFLFKQNKIKVWSPDGNTLARVDMSLIYNYIHSVLKGSIKSLENQRSSKFKKNPTNCWSREQGIVCFCWCQFCNINMYDRHPSRMTLFNHLFYSSSRHKLNISSKYHCIIYDELYYILLSYNSHIVRKVMIQKGHCTKMSAPRDKIDGTKWIRYEMTSFVLFYFETQNYYKTENKLNKPQIVCVAIYI